MMIGDMHISRLMVYVKPVEEEKLRDRLSIKARKLRFEMRLGSRKVV